MESGLRHIESSPPEDADTNRGLFADKSGDIVGLRGLGAAGVSARHALAIFDADDAYPRRHRLPHHRAEAKTADQKRRAMRAFITERLAGPAAMPSLLCEFDASGNLLGGSLCHATARDWANFGLLYLGNGLVAGARGGQPVLGGFRPHPGAAQPRLWRAILAQPAAAQGRAGGAVRRTGPARCLCRHRPSGPVCRRRAVKGARRGAARQDPGRCARSGEGGGWGGWSTASRRKGPP